METQDSAYRPAPFDKNQVYKFLGFHATTAVSVIARHIKKGYRLKDIEKRLRGMRIDLMFETPTGRTRIVEVKSSVKLERYTKSKLRYIGNTPATRLSSPTVI